MNRKSETSDKESPLVILRKQVQAFKPFLISRKMVRIIPLALLILVAGVALAQVTSQQNLSSYGTVKVVGVGLYWDKNCTSKVTSITWGTITPGTAIYRYVYIKNEGTTAGTLSMSYGNWTPSSASSYFLLAWNCSSYSLARNGMTCARFSLTVAQNITGVQDFSFVILIQATA